MRTTQRDAKPNREESMFRTMYSVITMVLMCSPFFSAHAQDGTIWVQRFDGSGGLHDYANAIALDNSDAVIVVGKTWSVQGNYDFLTVKYSSEGVFQWSASYDGGAGADDSAVSVSVSAQGDIYVGGTSPSASGNQDYLLIKYSPDGDTLWTRRYDNGSGDKLAEVATDIFGNVIVTGSSVSSNGYDYTTIKYSSAGSQLWVCRYSGLAGQFHDYAYALHVDREGNVYITGTSWRTHNGFYDRSIGTVKYNANGTAQWAAHREEYEPCAGFDVTSDNAGNVYVTGHEWSFSGYQKSNYVTLKYSPTGAEVWTRLYNGPASNYDYGRKVTVDQSGNVYVTGESYATGSNYDIMTIAYNASGTVVGSNRYNGPISDNDYGRDIVYVGADSILVIGTSPGDGSSSDIVSILYDGQCNIYDTWPRRFNGAANFADMGVAAAVGSSGLYVTGTSDGGDTFYDVLIMKYERGPGPSKILLDSVVIDSANGGSVVVAPDAMPIIGVGDQVTIHGTVTAQDGSPIADATVTVFDGVSYLYDASDDGIFQVQTDADGRFSHTCTAPTEVLATDETVAYWLATGTAALPLIMVHRGECSDLDCIGLQLEGIAADLQFLPDGSVISMSTLENPLTLAFPIYPPEDQSLTSAANDLFFEGYGNVYSGPTDHWFLEDTESGWLLRGLEQSSETVGDVASALHDYAGNKAGSMWEPVLVKLDGQWHALSKEERIALRMAIDWSNVDWLGVGIGAAACGLGIAAGGVIGIATCTSFGITVANELAFKPILVPHVCDEILHADNPQKCRDLGENVADGLTLVAQFAVFPPANANWSGYKNYFNMSKSFIKKASWTAHLVNETYGWYRTGVWGLDVADSYLDYAPPDGTGYKQAVALEDFRWNSEAVGGLTLIPLQMAVTDRVGPSYQIIQTFDLSFPPTALHITVRTSRATYADIVPIQPLAPLVQIQNGDSPPTLFEWTDVDFDLNEYYLTVPVADIPNHVPGQFLDVTLLVASQDIFGNASNGSGFCGGGWCPSSGITFAADDGTGIVIGENGVAQDAYITRTTEDIAVITSGFKDTRDTLDSTLVLSSVATLYQPDTLTLLQPVQVIMKVDSADLDDVLSLGFDVRIARWDSASASFVRLATQLDSASGLATAETDQLGAFFLLGDISIDYICGDVNSSGSDPDISDLVYIIDYMFRDGPPPPLPTSADVDGSGGPIDISDLVYLIDYMFTGGPAPVCGP